MTTIINKMPKKQIKCAVFDLDGTLLNTIKTISYYLNLALSKNGLRCISESDCQRFVGNGASLLVERALWHISAYSESMHGQVFSDYNDAYDANPYYLTEPYPGVVELLSDLRARGVSLAVLSNKPHTATSAAVSHFFPGMFDVVQGGVEGLPLKPCPDSLLSIISDLGSTSEQTAYVGDSEVDVLTAKNAAVGLSLSVTWGFRTRRELELAGAVTLVDSPTDIEALI